MRGLGQRGATVRDRLMRGVDLGGAVDLGGVVGLRERNGEKGGYLMSSISFHVFWAIHLASFMLDPSIPSLRSSFIPSPPLPLSRRLSHADRGSFLSGVGGAARF